MSSSTNSISAVTSETEKLSSNRIGDSKTPCSVGSSGSSAAGSNSSGTSNVHYEGSTAVYIDPSTHVQYEWNTSTNQWQPRSNYVYSAEHHAYVCVDKDGTQLLWDTERNGWFPLVDDEFIACYQLNYGVNAAAGPETVAPQQQKTCPATTAAVGATTPTKPSEPTNTVQGEKRKPTAPHWFQLDDSQNTKVYVSNLPLDTTEEEFVEFMQKCGLIMKDANSGRYKIKLYKDRGTDYLKGDALCTYIKIESVELALQLLDGSDFKGKRVSVERARFEMKGAYNPDLKPKMQKRKDKMKLKHSQEKMFDWRPEKAAALVERPKHEKVVVVRNLFAPAMFENDVGLILEMKEDLREEAAKLGQVRRVQLWDHHPDGVAQIFMSSPEEADAVVQLINGRSYMQRKLTAELWDGKSKFKTEETDAQTSSRLQKWNQYLESDK